ncbi:MAG TPA: DUF4352 domain-containing protein [Candidatus Nanoarchaeia archaeon]
MEETAQEPQKTPEAEVLKSEASPPPKPKGNKKPIIITIVIAVVLIITAVAGVYLWQQGKVRGLSGDKNSLEDKMASQSAQLAELGKENTNLKSRVVFLEKSLREATASAQAQGELTPSVGNVSHYTSKIFSEPSADANDFLLIDLTVKNSSKQTLYFSIFNLKLKDDENKAYPYYTTAAPYLANSFDLPKGKVELRDQQVNADETVTGTVIFFVPKTKNLFTLLYNTSKFTITAK